MVNPVHNSLSIEVCESSYDAVAKGYDYVMTDPKVHPIEVVKVVVVKNGTVGGDSTVDFVLQDESGKKYVFIVTGKLLRSIPC